MKFIQLGGVFALRFGLLSWSRQEAILMALLQLAVVFDQLSWIVVHRLGNTVSGITHGFDSRIVFHGSSFSPSSSRGVTKAGTNKPRIPLTRRMWANLLALAKCRQFHVSKKSHL